jgi:hypothetical protein
VKNARRSRNDSDPDESLLRGAWLLWAAGAIVLLGAAWLGLAAQTLPLMALLAAALLLWPLYRALRALWHWTRWRAHAKWHGRHFEFDGRQIRVLFDDDRVLVVAADVFDALGIDAAGRGAERVRRIAGRDGLVTHPDAGELVFTERGLSAWMERRTARDADRFARWFEAEVLAPHRRRVEVSKTAW